MVQGHSFHALLDPSVREASWFCWHVRLHGLTAPMFLFASGLAFGVTTLGRFADHARLGPELWHRMRRYGLLLAIGYALQLPGQSLIAPLLRGTLLTPGVLRIGPLQAVGVVLGSCQLLVVVCRRRERFIACIAALTVLMLGSSPWIWQQHLSSAVSLPVAMWLDSTRGSNFPLFPWAAFVLLGVLTAEIVRGRPLRSVASGLALAGAALAVLAPALWYGGYGPAAWMPADTSPFFVFQRLGYVLLTLAGLCALELAQGIQPGAWSSLSAQLSRRSLLAYVVHLLVLYGTPFTPNIAVRIGPTLALGPALLAAAAVLLVTVLAALLWDELASPERAEARRRAQLSLVCVALYCLVARDAFDVIRLGWATQ